MHHQHKVGVDQRRDRNQIAHELVGFPGEQRFVDGLRARDHQQGVAVGSGAGDQLGADCGTGAGPVLDHERLMQGLLQFLRNAA